MILAIKHPRRVKNVQNLNNTIFHSTVLSFPPPPPTLYVIIILFRLFILGRLNPAMRLQL